MTAESAVLKPGTYVLRPEDIDFPPRRAVRLVLYYLLLSQLPLAPFTLFRLFHREPVRDCLGGHLIFALSAPFAGLLFVGAAAYRRRYLLPRTITITAQEVVIQTGGDETVVPAEYCRLVRMGSWMDTRFGPFIRGVPDSLLLEVNGRVEFRRYVLEFADRTGEDGTV